MSIQFGPYGAIETIEFDDTSTIDLTTMSHVQYGTAADDLLYGVTEGGSPDDELHGGDGNDTINAYNGDNIVYGDAGNDKIYAGSGNDTIYGGDGDDYIDGGSGDNVFYTGAGNDTVKSGDGDDTYYYTGGHDVYTEGWSSTDEIYLASGYTSGATVYYRINKDLKIVFDENNTITIKSFFHSTAYRIETLHFDGGPSVDLTAANDNGEHIASPMRRSGGV